ncbi:hypothetical protein DVH24_035470 [Malus domestica]|uniref:Uncharacterized protein n=1 Tax=Malus domestica TaxID=3750 RepID=A0A498J690_MALDO|nr:hypothetical protein DVH24_035470 [Malus domestica]
MKKSTMHAKVIGMQRENFLLWRFQAEVQKMRVEMASIKRDAEHYSRQWAVWLLQDLLEVELEDEISVTNQVEREKRQHGCLSVRSG